MLFCSKAFIASVLRPNCSRVTFSIPSAVCHGVVFLRTWLLPICAYLPLPLCPPTTSGVGFGHLQALPALQGTLDLQRYALVASPQNRTWLWGRAECFYGCREVGCSPLLASPLLPGSWIRRRQAWRSWAGFRHEQSQDGDCGCGWLGSLLTPSYHLGTNQPCFLPSLPLSHPLSLPFSISSPNQGSSRGPNTVSAVSVLLSQYFLVCSHPVSVWSTLMPTSQNKTYLLSVWPFCTLLS